VNCLIPGCGNPARNKLGLRCRKPTTRAVWAPDSEAYLCKQHAEGGVHITVMIEPAQTKTVTVTYGSGTQHAPSRTTPIRRKAS
jgi:hypothetical protein